MAHWTHPDQLVLLEAFYEKVRADPTSVTDDEFLTIIRKAYWPTNCWAFVAAAFAIIAPGCLMRPHLARDLIRDPIDAMIAGGLTDPNEIVAQGVACATNFSFGTEPSPEGKKWLTEEWPLLESEAKAVFSELWNTSVSNES